MRSAGTKRADKHDKLFSEKSVDIGLSVATKDEELARVAGRSDETDRRD
jgi:hypothetical protein